jgi:homospermidine synthase
MNASIVTKNERIQMIKDTYNSFNFNHKIWLLGFGAIGHSLIYTFVKMCKMDLANITVFDKNPVVEKNVKTISDKIKFVNVDIVEDNYLNLFKDIQKDDIMIDCCYDINTLDLFKLCQNKGVSYINSSIEKWSYYNEKDPIKYSLMDKRRELEIFNNTLTNKKTNFLVSMGCNPGNVSIWAKYGLDFINKKYNYPFKSYAELAHKLGVQVIHISEKDTQKTNKPKRENEYCNTWASTMEPMYEEAVGPVEISWGTHEKKIPEDAVTDPNKTDNLVILKRRGMSAFATSYVPISKEYIGMMIRHDEAFTIGRELSYYEGNKLVSKPSIYYVYHPCDATMLSFHELRERNLDYQKNYRLLTSDVTEGRDELGLTYFLKNGDVYWVGSLLDIEESREIYDHKFDEFINATIVQVVGGYLGGIIYLIDQINKQQYHGLLCPDDLPHNKTLDVSLPFFGDFVMMKVEDWDFNKRYDNKFPGVKLPITSNWQLDDFIVKY